MRELRAQAFEANRRLAGTGLVLGTFGNVSAVDRSAGVMAIKPSGVSYDTLTPEHIVLVSLESGAVMDGTLRPSSDTPTHVELYRAFPNIGGIVHTHSEYATSWAQARRPIPCFGTTHADYFHGPVPVTRVMSDSEIASEYEKNTGHAIVRAFEKVEYASVPAVLVANHGPFAWGPDPAAAAHNAVILEAVARMAYFTATLSSEAEPVGGRLHDKHYLRKHGSSAYYGQAKEKK